MNASRQHNGKGTALPDFALQDNLTAQEVSQMLNNGQPQAGAAMFTRD
jgi:hypothetical protein